MSHIPVDDAFCFAVFIWKGLKLSMDRLKTSWPSFAGPGKNGWPAASCNPMKTLEYQMSVIGAPGPGCNECWHLLMAFLMLFLERRWPSQYLRSWCRYLFWGTAWLCPPAISYSLNNSVQHWGLSGIFWCVQWWWVCGPSTGSYV